MREGGIDWGQAEALAFASLLVEGIPIRLSGQDTERGTFSHRHAVLHDQRTGETYAPIQHLPDARRLVRDLQLAAVRVRLPRLRVRLRGRRAGRARALGGAVRRLRQRRPDRVDQFLVAGLSKWGQTSRLTLLLPHGYEGNGPEHSSAQARALPAARRAGEHPHRELHDRGAVLPPAPPPGARRDGAAARRDDAQGAAAAEAGGLDARRPLRGPVRARARRSRRRPQCGDDGSCSAPGSSTTTSTATRSAPTRRAVAVARIEQLYPFPVEPAAALTASYPHLRELVWAQEEPQNMGAWRTIRHRLEAAAPDGVRGRVRRAGRGARARARATRPRTGVEQDRIVREALGRTA